MFCNSINSGDIALFYSFLNTYTLPSLCCKFFISSKTKTTPRLRNLYGTFETQGHLTTAFFVFGVQQFAPDFVVRHNNTFIRTWNTSEKCELQCNLPLKGTILFDLPVKQIAELANHKARNFPVDDSPTLINVSNSSPKLNKSMFINRLDEIDVLENQKLFPTPQLVQVHVQMLMKINENREIEEIIVA